MDLQGPSICALCQFHRHGDHHHATLGDQCQEKAKYSERQAVSLQVGSGKKNTVQQLAGSIDEVTFSSETTKDVK